MDEKELPGKPALMDWRFKIDYLRTLFLEYQNILRIQEETESRYAKAFNPEDKYGNPFHGYDLERVLRERRNGVIRYALGFFLDEYPNMELPTDTLVEQYGARARPENSIDFHGLIAYLSHLESVIDEQALDCLLRHAIRLLPHSMKYAGYNDVKKIEAANLVRNSTLILYAGTYYGSPNTEHTRRLAILASVVLNGERASKAGVYSTGRFTYYKNGRVDYRLDSKNDAHKLAERVVKAWNEEGMR